LPFQFEVVNVKADGSKDDDDDDDVDDQVKSSSSISRKKTAVTTKMVQHWSHVLQVSLIIQIS